LMEESNLNCLAVVQGECPIGIVGQRDVIRANCRLEEQAEYHQEIRPTGTIQLATRPSPLIRGAQRLSEAAAAMIDHDLPAVTVVSPDNRLLGLVTEDNLLRVLYDALS